ncbi:MAG: DUF6088 family protein [Myxococcota bacterium]
MASVQDQIWARVRRKGRGHVYVPSDFLDLGSRAAVDQALGRLVRSQKLRRVTRGVYDYPTQHSQLGMVPPSLHRVAQAIARSTGSRLQISGAQAANTLGLSTQLPAQLVYLTDGPTRTVAVGNRKIHFRHASPRTLAGAGSVVGAVLQAFRFLGPQAFDDAAVRKVRRAVSTKDRGMLQGAINQAPAWMRGALAAIAEPDQAEAI